MIKLSVIVPVYNVEKYINKCLDSLINQTLKDIEFIFVNDGSLDNSVKIIKEYQKKDKRIKLFNKKNGGQASARNLGLKKANGEYIAFLDSDDYVKEDMYEILYNRAKKDNLDIVICNYYLVYPEKIIENRLSITNDMEKIISPREYIVLSPSPWNKIIRHEYLTKQNFMFPEGIIYEDLASIPLLGLGNPKTVFLNQCLYYYVQSSSSTMRNNEYKSKYENIFPATEYLYNNMIGRGYDKELEYLLTYHLLYLGSLNFYKFKKYQQIDIISANMKKYFSKWYKNELVKLKFTKKQIFYMQLFYHKKYFLINIYRRFVNKHE
ncbi:MAG: glycosyltransferase [Erysipelotrichaceae bacterium]|nr:glycosyltransferase [Erysipelotrichaceae bacterium]